ncbi:MAG: tRNA dihydrouridine synthase DusB [Elusimicrobiota bacterium]
MIKIENYKINTNLIMAPMAGVTDLPYRLINRKYGCKFAFTEMVNVRGLSYKNRKTFKLMQTTKDDRPLGIQLEGSKKKYFLKALEKIKDYPHALLDINAGCPAKKVVKKGAGAALMQTPEKLRDILKAIVKESGRPVTLKLRAGWDKNSLNAPLVARQARDAGVKAIFIHGRHRMQGFKKSVDYKTIKKVVDSVDIPVIGSGDIFSPMAAEMMLDKTGCDGLLVARGTYGNPWIFRDIKEYLNTGKLNPLAGVKKISGVMREHLDLLTKYFNTENGIYRFRKYFVHYTRYFKYARPLREKVFNTTDKDTVLHIIGLFEKNCRRQINTYSAFQ